LRVYVFEIDMSHQLFELLHAGSMSFI
jgi:hypothetical protein